MLSKKYIIQQDFFLICKIMLYLVHSVQIGGGGFIKLKILILLHLFLFTYVACIISLWTTSLLLMVNNNTMFFMKKLLQLIIMLVIQTMGLGKIRNKTSE